MLQEIIELFNSYKQYFGLADKLSLNAAIEYEEKFNEVICKYQGHNIGPDERSKIEHNYCYRCFKTVEALGLKCKEDGSYCKI